MCTPPGGHVVVRDWQIRSDSRIALKEWHMAPLAGWESPNARFYKHCTPGGVGIPQCPVPINLAPLAGCESPNARIAITWQPWRGATPLMPGSYKPGTPGGVRIPYLCSL